MIRSSTCQLVNQRKLVEMDDRYRGLLREHLRLALIHEYQVTRFEVWRGKSGLYHYDVEEVADVVIEALRPLLDDENLVQRAESLHQSGSFAPVPPPLDPNDW